MIFPLQRVLIELPVLLVRHVSFLYRKKTFVNVLDLDLTFSCVSTSPQISLYRLEAVMNLTQNYLCLSGTFLIVQYLPLPSV